MLLRTYLLTANRVIPSASLSNYSRHLSIKVAVVGSGPAGFYTTQKLIKNPDISVDIYEKLPVPFGLVRYGVAPDHGEVKNVIKSFTTVANSDRVNFYGNVSLGDSIILDDLVSAYHAVVLCYGSAQDRLLNIEGENTTKNMISARNFVGWYNGVPEDKELQIDLDCDTACIIGQGNVALDCARILLKPANLEKTDITSYAQQLISRSKIRKIYIVGRRGPMQVSFTIKELRELIKLNEGYTRIRDPNLLKNISLTHLNKMVRHRRRLTELMLNLSTVPKKDNLPEGAIECIFEFFAKPTKILSDSASGKVNGLEIQRTQYLNFEDFMNETAKPVETEMYEKIDCGLIIRSTGYKSIMLDKNLPVNNQIGAILNTNGKVHGHKNIYCSGWLATGASGVIAGTLNSSRITADSILKDIEKGELQNLKRVKLGYELISNILLKKSVQVVHFNDWLRIDELEKRMGDIIGKTREKMVEIDKMLEVARDRSEK